MNETLKNLIKSPRESFLHRTSKGISKEEKVKVLSDLEQAFKDNRSLLEDTSVTLDESFEQRIASFYLIAQKELLKRGIKNVTFVPSFFHSWKEKFNAGVVSLGAISISLNERMIRNEANQIFLLDILSHELYHSTAPAKFVSSKNKEKDGLLSQKYGLGASYYVKDGALEEGLAVSFQKQMREEIFKLFDESVVESYRKALIVVKEDWLLSERTSEEDFDTFGPFPYFKLGLNEKESLHFDNPSEYIPPVKLVTYLSTKFDENGFDFLNLVEKMRINNESFGFAKKFEGLFGEGSFRKLVTTPLTNTETLLAELQQSYKK